MQPRPAPISKHFSDRAQNPRQRFLPVMHLESYDLVGLVHQSQATFDSPVAFGPITGSQPRACPAEWLGDQIETALGAADSTNRSAGPIHVSAPSTALGHPDTPRICETAVHRVRACAQEVCLDFEDSAFFDTPKDAVENVGALRSRGFRVGIDARKSWQAGTTPPLRMLIDSVRVQADHLDTEPDLASRVKDVAAEGVSIVAERARWRDAELLQALGVGYVVAPSADA